MPCPVLFQHSHWKCAPSPDSCALRLQSLFFYVSDFLFCTLSIPIRRLFILPLPGENLRARIELLFKTHNSPRPPQAPAASFKSLYRKCSGPRLPPDLTFFLPEHLR